VTARHYFFQQPQERWDDRGHDMTPRALGVSRKRPVEFANENLRDGPVSDDPASREGTSIQSEQATGTCERTLAPYVCTLDPTDLPWTAPLPALRARKSTPQKLELTVVIRCVQVDLGTRRKFCVTRGNQHVAEIIQALGITQLDPPSPPEGRECLV